MSLPSTINKFCPLMFLLQFYIRIFFFQFYNQSLLLSQTWWGCKTYIFLDELTVFVGILSFRLWVRKTFWFEDRQRWVKKAATYLLPIYPSAANFYIGKSTTVCILGHFVTISFDLKYSETCCDTLYTGIEIIFEYILRIIITVIFLSKISIYVFRILMAQSTTEREIYIL